MGMIIFIGADHGGYAVKEKLKELLDSRKIGWVDVGGQGKKDDNYPEFAVAVARNVQEKKNARGILVCGTGTGMSIVANRFVGVRAAVCYDTYSAKMSRTDNDANILCLRGRKNTFKNIEKIVNTWLKTPFSKLNRYKKRIAQTDEDYT